MRDWLPVILWMAAIFWGSSRSTLPGPLGVQSAGGDWLRNATHMAEYAILAALTHRALRQTSAAARRALSFPSHFSFLIPMLFPLLFALSDEWHQSFVPGRQCTLADLALDAAGAALGLLAIRLCQRLSERLQPVDLVP